MSVHFTQITPFVPCTPLEQQIAFYRDVLGFSDGGQGGNHASASRDNAALRHVEVWDTVDLSHPEREGSFYVNVEGLVDLYALMKPKLDTLPESWVRPPFNQDFGQREFHVKYEDCTLIFSGEAL